MEILEAAPTGAGPSLAVHGGAGSRGPELDLEDRARYEQGLVAAYRAGWQALSGGGDALDAVCASVEVLEADPLFNAGRGAALTASGQAELDASVMTGSGSAGAVAASKHARSPVRLARAVMEHTDQSSSSTLMPSSSGALDSTSWTAATSSPSGAGSSWTVCWMAGRPRPATVRSARRRAMPVAASPPPRPRAA
jgi:isoaspartyl peptidase/L-asparaginase-like protein (Ntn-hydrolase superfamily)